MEDALKTWLMDNRPYTHLHVRVKHFILFCRSIEPGLSYTYLKKTIVPIVDTLLQGELGRLWKRDRCYERTLRLYGHNDQRTDQWLAKRGEMITASEVYKVFQTEESRRDLLLKKLEPPVQTGAPSNPVPALVWGTRFEPVAKKIYEERTNCKITDVSCVQHPIYPFLGASPDGLIVPNTPDDRRYGRLVEFKCPMSRVEKPEIPPAYIHQMQMQMECTGIDECEYVEFRFKQVFTSEWMKSTQTKGCFAVYEDGRIDYDIDHHPEDAQMIYWVLQSIKEDFVARDPNWLTDHIEGLSAFWNEVLDHRKNGTKPPEKEKPKLPSMDL